MQLWEIKIRDPVYFMIGKLPGSIVNDVLQLFELTWLMKFCTAVSWVHCITNGRYVLGNDYYMYHIVVD